ncbi:hypothetical protein, partial [Metallosphaera javensis (ex Hofmann et al. 2022)]|uniref:hypothetical protein n=1 Tax=Metallosphaera javensis (ex Hofmann et al. 2022) TaxID=99938 RepID=UPI001EE0F139
MIGSAAGSAVFAWILAAHGFGAAAGALLGLTTPLALAALLVRENPGDALFRLRGFALRQRRAPGGLAFATKLLS